MYSYEYPRAALTVDCVVFGLDDQGLQVLLIERGVPPFEGCWALPGGFVGPTETLDEAARRELREETGVRYRYLEQLSAFSAPNRDPRERVITIAYYALVKLSAHRLHAATDARRAEWFALDQLPALAFDHASIIAAARQRLKGKVRSEPIGFELLPTRFTLRQLQQLYEHVLERPLDKRNFRRKILGMGVLAELDQVEQGVAHRAARYYQFDQLRYRQLQRDGFHFEI